MPPVPACYSGKTPGGAADLALEAALARPVDRSFFARSGALIGNLADPSLGGGLGGQYQEPAQAGETRLVDLRSADVVTLTFGGNNVGFKDKAFYCYWNSSCDSRLIDGTFTTRDSLIAAINSLSATDLSAPLPKLPAAYALAWNSTSPDTPTFVLGYPRLFPIENYRPDLCGSPMGNSFQESERTLFRDAVDRLNLVIKCSAALAGVHYVDVVERFAGHGICEGTSYVDRWINPVLGTEFRVSPPQRAGAQGTGQNRRERNQPVDRQAPQWPHSKGTAP